VSTSTFALDSAVDYYRAVTVTLPTVLRAPTAWSADATSGVVLTFTPDLTAGETTTLATFMSDISTMAKFGVTLTLAEWQSVKPDAQLLKAYAGVASPTLAQTVAAVKAQSRILSVIIRS
jgi:hypothetical protein